MARGGGGGARGAAQAPSMPGARLAMSERCARRRSAAPRRSGDSGEAQQRDGHDEPLRREVERGVDGARRGVPAVLDDAERARGAGGAAAEAAEQSHRIDGGGEQRLAGDAGHGAIKQQAREHAAALHARAGACRAGTLAAEAGRRRAERDSLHGARVATAQEEAQRQPVRPAFRAAPRAAQAQGLTRDAANPALHTRARTAEPKLCKTRLTNR